MQKQDEVLLNLAVFRENLNKMMQPEVLKKLVGFLEATGTGDNDNTPLIEKYKWFVENSTDGIDCKYAAMAKEFFLENQAEGAAKAITWLYQNWARFYND